MCPFLRRGACGGALPAWQQVAHQFPRQAERAATREGLSQVRRYHGCPRRCAVRPPGQGLRRQAQICESPQGAPRLPRALPPRKRALSRFASLLGCPRPVFLAGQQAFAAPASPPAGHSYSDCTRSRPPHLGLSVRPGAQLSRLFDRFTDSRTWWGCTRRGARACGVSLRRFGVRLFPSATFEGPQLLDAPHTPGWTPCPPWRGTPEELVQR